MKSYPMRTKHGIIQVPATLHKFEGVDILCHRRIIMPGPVFDDMCWDATERKSGMAITGSGYYETRAIALKEAKAKITRFLEKHTRDEWDKLVKQNTMREEVTS